MALAGILGSTPLTGIPVEQHRFLFLGAGEAGAGIAELIAYAIHVSSSTSRNPTAVDAIYYAILYQFPIRGTIVTVVLATGSVCSLGNENRLGLLTALGCWCTKRPVVLAQDFAGRGTSLRLISFVPMHTLTPRFLVLTVGRVAR